jgi:hypothetical protein
MRGQGGRKPLKRLMTIVCASALAFALVGASSAGAGTGDDHSLSVQAKQCAAMKKADKAAFKATFGDHAMRHCIKGEPVDPTVSEFKNAAKECKAEREADADLFHETWGSNNNGRNALGKCVSSHVKHTEEEGGDDEGGTGDVA